MSLGLPPKDLPKAMTFVRLLASDQDGEVVGAARALGRMLRRNGKDFHDIAALLTIAGTPTPQPTWTPPPSWAESWTWTDEEDEKPKAPAEPPDVKTMKRADQLAWCRLCLERLALERDDEVVVPDMASRLAGQGYYLNREQLKVMNRIVRRAWRLGLRP